MPNLIAQMNMLVRGAAAAAVTAMLMPAVIAPADAANRRRAEPSERQVTACSHFGHGCVTARVRVTRIEQQFRLPGGTWIGCAQDCKTKLTDETVDFWDRKGDESGVRRH